ncbi:hypothetical protein V9K67_26620 [Paraflavisolibacter sp. H34]|uniref:hypothetical protein n=1 Tax=Huijunlia imazamoxiresistens TaxID=3127457 RepID=UPI0030181192
MTFEDYKKKVGIFGKIDTAEKLDFLKRQYENELLRAEDQNYFEPYESNSGDGLNCLYEQNLNQIFSLGNIEENQFYFLVKPSFEPEYLLVLTRRLHDYLLTCTKLTENYWSVFYADKTITTIDSTSFKLVLVKSIGDKLFYVLDKVMTSARSPKSKFFTLDGVVYVISKVSDGKVRSVFKHSPDEDSKSGELISIMEQLSDNIHALNAIILKDIEVKIDELIT